jgi:hypothetical protein
VDWNGLNTKMKSGKISKSGKVPNPNGNRARKYANGSNAARKAMVECGLGTGDDGIWKLAMLKKELRVIVQKQKLFRWN